MALIPKFRYWTWRDHHLIDGQGHVYMGTPVGWGFDNHVYKDSIGKEREVTLWLYLIALQLIWE